MVSSPKFKPVPKLPIDGELKENESGWNRVSSDEMHARDCEDGFCEEQDHDEGGDSDFAAIHATRLDDLPWRGRRRKHMFLIAGAVLLIAGATAAVAHRSGVRSSVDESNSDVGGETQTTDTALASAAPKSMTGSASSTDGKDISEKNECQGDRLQNGIQLSVGESLCSTKNGYAFGFTVPREFALTNSDLNETVATYYSASSVTTNNHGAKYFMLSANATMAVYDKSGSVLWQRPCKKSVTLSKKCLGKFDCPYLHLHSDGVMVLNWIDSAGQWNEKNIKKLYKF